MYFLITAGGTREYIDPVRFISNASSGKMGYARTGGMGDCAAQILKGDFLVSHRLDYLRPGDKHMAGVFDHNNEISWGGKRETSNVKSEKLKM